MSEVNAIEILKKIYVFEDLNHEQLEKVAQLLKPVKAKEGKTIIKENTKGDDIFIILDGQVRVSRFINGKEEAITFLNPGDIFGEMAILGKQERSATVIAHTDLIMFKFKGKEFKSLLDSDINLGFFVYRKMAQTLAKRLKELDKRYHDILALVSMW
ncbi:CRP/FNR family transcriptional regulator, anaerobic regulatory protein [Thermotomaculum hydrothermale]|uniref:CRP/FNR family transcriptional regulator, anaerobic regulatory protein n=1 Tax=Thermotomaculum hydrothermale TaxID=981385 RepID=A0A7R6SZW6_9BACT|nr:cyclic nucleotide-binding domain-containing protein [Thermotomaculum hydrothermale]BBB33210.1 CRP/FNR family transcriptional regulator, anaerobic regulatory protein [Thermotomaculum hydrothermale]